MASLKRIAGRIAAFAASAVGFRRSEANGSKEPTFGAFIDRGSLPETAFFKWFSFEPTAEATQGDQIVYRPSGPAFHALVSLTVDMTPAGQPRSFRLAVARAFYDNPQRSPFARDVIKSFLLAIAGSDAIRLQSLIEEISFRDLRGPMFMRGESPKLSAEPSPAFQRIAGTLGGIWKSDLSRITLHIWNEGGAIVVQAT